MDPHKNIGYTNGRFQPPHNGHFAVWERILREYEQLWIGIANPENTVPKLLLDYIMVDPEVARAVIKTRRPKNNPYSYEERRRMILKSLQLAGYDLGRIKVAPHYSFYDHSAWRDFMPPKETSTILVPVKDGYHLAKISLYEIEGWKVETIPLIGFVSGKVLDMAWARRKRNSDWRNLVTRGTEMFLETRI